MISLYLFCFILSLIASLVFTPVAILLSIKFNILDMPERRKVHSRPIPRLGGLGIFLAFTTCLLLAYLFFPELKKLLSSTLLQKSKIIGTLSLNTQLMGILIGSTFTLILGVIDDKKSVQAMTKLLVQIIVAYCALDFGVRIYGLTIPFGGKYIEFPILLSQFFTVLWLIGFMNTINLIDGLDGLATGIVAIASGTFFIVTCLLKLAIPLTPEKMWLANQLQLSSILSITLCGACVGFLFFNFNPARIFLGDGGALFMGFLLASISILGTLKIPIFLSLLIPVTIIALPILDVLLAILRRLSHGDVMKPDKEHLHHRILRWGWSQKEVVLLMYSITLILSIVTISLTTWKLINK